jgi:hypothetical protein
MHGCRLIRRGRRRGIIRGRDEVVIYGDWRPEYMGRGGNCIDYKGEKQGVRCMICSSND